MNEISRERCQAAVLTPSGRGAVATIRLEGSPERIERAGFSPASRKPLSDQPIRRLWFGLWGDAPSEEVVLGRLDERAWELHCHGGHAAVRRILHTLRELGWEMLEWKALLAEREPFPLIEHQEALSLALTWKTTEALLRNSPEKFVEKLNKLVSELDSTSWIDERSQAWSQHWQEMLEWASFGRHLTVPFRVILAGEPNVGKSSLLNRLAGFERAIVHDRPGTTRDVVRTQCAFEGWPFELSDTAGIRSQAEKLESLGIEKTLAEVAQADLVLFLVDVSRPPSPTEEDCLQHSRQVLRIGHKTDLPIHSDRDLSDATILVSSLNETGIEELISAMVDRLIPQTPPIGIMFPISTRQVELLERLRAVCEKNELEMIQKTCEQLLHPETVTDEALLP